MRDPKERVLDILDAIAAIERHHGQDKAAFERDELLQVWSYGTCRSSVKRPGLYPQTCERWLRRFHGRR